MARAIPRADAIDVALRMLARQEKKARATRNRLPDEPLSV